MSKLAYYRDVLGFDHAEHVPFTKQYRIKCSQCEALVNVQGCSVWHRVCNYGRRDTL